MYVELYILILNPHLSNTKAVFLFSSLLHTRQITPDLLNITRHSKKKKKNEKMLNMFVTPFTVKSQTCNSPAFSICNRSCPKPRPKHAKITLCDQKGEENEESNTTKPASLPPGSSTSEGKETADLGFVGADKIGISFVCMADDCNTRVVKSVRRRSYERGTVVVKCPGCEKHHVIADNFGMYSSLTGGKINIEEIAKAKGTSVTRVDNTVFNLENIFNNVEAEKNSEENKKKE